MYRITCLVFACSALASAQTAAPEGAPAQLFVTVGHSYGPSNRILTRDDLMITQHYGALPITSVTPLKGERGGLELYFLVDHCSNCEPGSKFEELRRFIAAQPATTSIGVAYIRNGQLEMGQTPTTNRERAVNALNTPEGSKPASPFDALSQLIRTWPQNGTRHMVLMITNGIDPTAPEALQDPSAEGAIETAQKAGVTVFGIYHPSADYATSDFSKVYSGQVQLAHLATETGGEAYFLGFGPLPSLAPFLADINDHLANQYLVEFVARPAEGPGALADVAVKSTVPNLELMVPDRVWIPGVPASHGKPNTWERKRP